MTDRARELVADLRRGCSCGKCKHDACCCQTMEEAADFIEQTLTPPEGDTVPSTVAAMLAEWVENGCEEVPQDLASRITALQSRPTLSGEVVENAIWDAVQGMPVEMSFADAKEIATAAIAALSASREEP